MRIAVACMCLAGCSFSTQLTGDDMPPEAGTTSLDGCTTFSTALDTCAIGMYGPGVSISANRKYDTDTHVLSDDDDSNPSTPTFREVMVGGNPITVLVVEGFTIQMLVRLRRRSSRRPASSPRTAAAAAVVRAAAPARTAAPARRQRPRHRPA